VIIGDIAFDSKVQGGRVRTDIGGGVYGCAVGAGFFSSDVGLVSRVGTDFPLQEMTYSRANLQGIRVTDEPLTPHFRLNMRENGEREVEAVVELDAHADTRFFPEAYSHALLYHLSTSHPCKYLEWIPFLRRINPDAWISVDAFELYAQRFPVQTLQAMQQADLIFLNEAELHLLSEPNIWALGKPILLKRGANGAVYRMNDVEYSQPAPVVDAVDTTGAGDVFAGAFLTLRLNGLSIAQALAASVLLATLSVTQTGLKHLSGEQPSED
jgi:ribokinase